MSPVSIVDAVLHAFERRVPHRDVARIPGLIVRAPQIDAGHPPGGQPPGDRGQDGAASATHVEHALVAAQAKAVEDFVPDLELAAPGRVEKAERVREKERAVESQHRRQRPRWLHHETIAPTTLAAPSAAKVTSA